MGLNIFFFIFDRAIIIMNKHTYKHSKINIPLRSIQSQSYESIRWNESVPLKRTDDPPSWWTTRLVFEAHISHSDRRDCFLGHRSVSNGEGSRNEGQGTRKGTDGEVERWSERKWDTSVRSVRRERPFRVKWRKVRWSGSWKESLRPCYPPETVALAARRKFFQHCERGGRLACSFLSYCCIAASWNAPFSKSAG